MSVSVEGNGNNYVYTATGLSGTAPGAGAVAGVPIRNSAGLIPSSTSYLVVSAIGMGGSGNTATPLPGVTANSTAGATTFTGLRVGNN